MDKPRPDLIPEQLPRTSDDKFTHEELVALLKRATTLQERGNERVYTTEDVVAAARELDIDPNVARGAAAELLSRRKAREIVPMPFDTRIQIAADSERLRIVVPPLRPRAGQLRPLVFVVIWIVFMAVLTVTAARASALLAAFSIPFWIAAFGMAAKFGLPLVRTTVLELGPGTSRLTLRPLGAVQEFRTEDLAVRVGVPSSAIDPRQQTAPSPALILEHGTSTIALLEGYDEQEHRWLESVIGDFLSTTSR